MKRFLCAPLPEIRASVQLDAASSHHLLVVCRVPRGASVVLFDGEGREVDAVLSGVSAGCAVLTATSDPRAADESRELHLVLGLPKAAALDHALRMAVELGVTHIHPAIAERSTARGDHRDRWERIAVAAAQQCGRADMPRITPLCPLFEASARVPRSVVRFIAVPGQPSTLPSTGAAALAVGPEGGFSAHEVEVLVREGWSPLGLGPLVLRVDTAVAVGLFSVQPRS